jgi:hypothetical protein
MYLVAFLSIVFGVVCCFWGYRLFRVILGILGFVVGAWFIGNLALGLSGGNIIIAVIAGIFGGLIGTFLIVFVYFIGIFLLGAGAAVLLVNLLASTAGIFVGTVFTIIIAIIGGILALVFQRTFVIIATALIGSWCFVSGLFYFFGSRISPFAVLEYPEGLFVCRSPQDYIMLAFWILLGIAGMAFQLRYGRRHPEE